MVIVTLCHMSQHKRVQVATAVRGHSLTTPTSAHLRSPPTYIHISLLSVHSYTYYYSLSSPDISDLRRCRGTYSIPPHPHSIRYHSHSPRFYNLLRPALESHSI